jgi:nucleoporin POM152
MCDVFFFSFFFLKYFDACRRYRVNGKLYTQEAKASPFSLVQQQPGEFAIVSVAHQQQMCKTAVTDLRYVVHPLPSAQVGHGKKVLQDIHEGMHTLCYFLWARSDDFSFAGDQAEVVFTLIGEPPFTFTYQRSELSPKKGGKPPKVLETHTVSGVTAREYSIYSALEGALYTFFWAVITSLFFFFFCLGLNEG